MQTCRKNRKNICRNIDTKICDWLSWFG